MSQPIFTNTRQAIGFAYLMATLPAREGGKLGKLLDRMKLEATGLLERRELSSINFAGLDDMEVRGQCAMIRSAVDHLPGPERWSIRSRFGEVHIQRAQDRSIARASYGVERTQAMLDPSAYLQPAMGELSVSTTLLLVARVCGDCEELRPSFRQIEAETGTSKSTAERWEKKVRARLNSLVNVGVDRLTPAFARDGLVPEPEMA